MTIFQVTVISVPTDTENLCRASNLGVKLALKSPKRDKNTNYTTMSLSPSYTVTLIHTHTHTYKDSCKGFCSSATAVFVRCFDKGLLCEKNESCVCIVFVLASTETSALYLSIYLPAWFEPQDGSALIKCL